MSSRWNDRAGGDVFRSFRGGNYSAHFCAYNRNKRSVVLDLKSDLGCKLALDLVRRSDIMIVNFRPGVMDRLKLSYETVKQANPNLIYCAISGFGDAGPYKERPCYDAVALATSGLASQFVDARQPRFTGPTISDNITGYTACYGILGALIERQRTGIARRIDVNMLEATMAFAAEMYHYYHQIESRSWSDHALECIPVVCVLLRGPEVARRACFVSRKILAPICECDGMRPANRRSAISNKRTAHIGLRQAFRDDRPRRRDQASQVLDRST